MIEAVPATVYRGGGRRYITLDAACRAEARKRVRKHYVEGGMDTKDIPQDEYHARVNALAGVLKNQFKGLL